MGPWLAGRAAKVIVDGIHVGCFGEMDTHVGHHYELKVPLSGAEFDLTELERALPDPV